MLLSTAAFEQAGPGSGQNTLTRDSLAAGECKPDSVGSVSYVPVIYRRHAKDVPSLPDGKWKTRIAFYLNFSFEPHAQMAHFVLGESNPSYISWFLSLCSKMFHPMK